MTLLFAYGLLRGQFDSPVASLMRAHAQPFRTATLAAHLYDLGGYPGVVAQQAGPAGNNSSLVLGELFTVPDNSHNDFWQQLDAFEGISSTHASPYEYQRRASTVTTMQQQSLQAWVYWYNWPIQNQEIITSGDYLTYIEHTQQSYGRHVES